MEDVTEQMLKGRLLVATPSLTEPTFSRTVIAMLEHNADGALGVVLNRPGDSALSDIVPPVADLATWPAVLFVGGPVEPSAAIALGVASTDEDVTAWRPVVPPLVSVDLDSDPALLASGLRQLRVFAGYAGWGPGQLESEIRQGAWYVVESLPSDAFVDAPEELWSRVLRRQPWPLNAVALCPVDPTMN